jgi:hypothetical protein
MSTPELLLIKAEDILRSGQPLPLDLVARLIDCGFIVEAIERKFQ